MHVCLRNKPVLVAFACLIGLGEAGRTECMNQKPVHISDACRFGFFDSVKNFLDQGGDSESRNDYGDPLFWTACYANHLDIAKLLLEKGANIDATDRYGNTSLHRACYTSNLTAAKFLLANKANIEVKDGSGRTALHDACIYDRFDSVQFLLENGADTTVSSRTDKNPLQAALRVRSEKIVKLLAPISYWVGLAKDAMPKQEELKRLETDPLILPTLLKRFDMQKNHEAASRLKQLARKEQWEEAFKATDKTFQEAVLSMVGK